MMSKFSLLQTALAPRCIEYIRAITVVGMYNDYNIQSCISFPANPPQLPSVLPDKIPETSATNNEFTFDIANTQHQTNSSDCGLFAIAFATELVHSQSPVLCDSTHL